MAETGCGIYAQMIFISRLRVVHTETLGQVFNLAVFTVVPRFRANNSCLTLICLRSARRGEKAISEAQHDCRLNEIAGHF